MTHRAVRPTIALALAALGAAVPLRAQEVTKPAASFTVGLNQDNFFGFYPTLGGTYGVGKNIDLSFYGILWTIPAFGLGGGGGNLWTEFGVGVRLHAIESRLLLKPQVGITNGSLLSGGAAGGASGSAGNGPAVLDGIVPSLTVNYSDPRFEGEWYSGYYVAARRPEGNTTLDFLHFWANAGVKFATIMSLGAHYEQLRNTRNSSTGTASNNYRWLGGYLQFALPMGMSARFTAGADIEDGNVGDFYKLGVGMSF